jgi:hypothetical protein
MKPVKIYKSGKIRGEKIKYPDGVGYCVWQIWSKDKLAKIDPERALENQNPEKESDDKEEAGLCFDIPGEDMEDLKKVVLEMVDAEPDFYEEDEEDKKYTEYRKKRDEIEKTWWHKIWSELQEISISFAPFDWHFNRLFISRPTPMENGTMVYRLCRGICLGPCVVTWSRF